MSKKTYKEFKNNYDASDAHIFTTLMSNIDRENVGTYRYQGNASFHNHKYRFQLRSVEDIVLGETELKFINSLAVGTELSVILFGLLSLLELEEEDDESPPPCWLM